MFYTYLWLREDGTPYYAGKGKGVRGFTSREHRVKCPSKDRIIIQKWPSEEDAFEAEKFLITYYGREDLGTGCLRNLTEGGENPPNHKGRKRSEETKKRMSKSRDGFRHSETSKRNMSKVRKHKPWTPARRAASLKLSDESRKRMSESHKGQKAWNEGKKLPFKPWSLERRERWRTKTRSI